MKSEYRRLVESSGLKYSELIDYGYDDNKETLIPEHVVINIVNELEHDVNTVLDMLHDITGLKEIDDIKDELKELSLKLY